MSGRLEGKRAVVTGAGSGIGLATAARFVEEGARVAFVDRDSAAISEAVSALGGDDGACLALTADVSEEEEIAAAIAAASDAWDGLDVVVANAAINGLNLDGRVHEMAVDVWYRIINVNLSGVFLTCRHGIRAILRTGAGGSVICTGSPTGMFGGRPAANAYSAAKGGVHALVRAMAADYARDEIRVNAVVPGFTDTPMVKRLIDDQERRDQVTSASLIQRPERPEEVAAMMCFLASDESSFATGGYFVVDGGATAI
jgi:NAD(P)-dependent dehydrogenase (short-subunit alcohol dehydrogenase family)